jgi:glycyl-tRNA synthetase
LLDAYEVIAGGRTTTTESIKEEEVVLKLHPKLAPYTVAVLPLSKKPELQKVANKIVKTFRQKWSVTYDETGSIGKRYRRQDEIGTPWCVTVDFDTLEGKKRKQGTVTVRDRDSMEQEDVAIEELMAYLEGKLK